MASPTPGPDPNRPTQERDAGTAPPPAGEALRRLAALDCEYRQLLEGLQDTELTAAEALTFLKLADGTRRTGHYAMVHASGVVAETQAHRLSQTALEQARELDAPALAAGAALPVNQLLPASAKPRFRSEVELISQVADLKVHAAKGLLQSHRQLVGTASRPARLPQLARQFADPQKNPEVISQAAAKIGSLQLRGRQLRSAESRVAQSTAEGHRAVQAELKSISDELSAPDLPEREAVHERCAGLRYRGLGPYGHVWELTCTTVDHEFLATLADRLVNPKLAVNRNSTSASSGDPAAQADPADPADPALSDDDRGSDPGSVKARKLLQMIMDSMRRAARSRPSKSPAVNVDDPGSNCEDAEPTGAVLPPMIDLIVTIDYDALRGATDAAGITSHGQRISATALRQSAAMAGIIPEVLGASGEILDYGRRRRLFTTAQTRAVVGRDRGCINIGCSMPAHRCEVNHVQPWYRGGKTCVNNGCLLCKGCHMAFHAGHFKIRMINGVPYVLQTRDRDPQQLWRRNWVWHPQAEALAA